jgi:hypothetical protein
MITLRQSLRRLAGFAAGLGAFFFVCSLFLPVAVIDRAPRLGHTGLGWFLLGFAGIPIVVLLAFVVADSSTGTRLAAATLVVAAGAAAFVVVSEIESSWRLNSCAWSRCPHGLIGGFQLAPGAAIHSAAIGSLLVVLGGILLALGCPLSRVESEARRTRVRSLILPLS